MPDADGLPLPNRIVGRKFIQYLIDLGIVRRGDFVRRVVIDAEVGDMVRIYMERFGDERLLQIGLDGLDGLTITTAADLHAQQKRELLETLIANGTDPDEAVRLASRQ